MLDTVIQLTRKTRNFVTDPGKSGKHRGDHERIAAAVRLIVLTKKRNGLKGTGFRIVGAVKPEP